MNVAIGLQINQGNRAHFDIRSKNENCTIPTDIILYLLEKNILPVISCDCEGREFEDINIIKLFGGEFLIDILKAII